MNIEHSIRTTCLATAAAAALLISGAAFAQGAGSSGTTSGASGAMSGTTSGATSGMMRSDAGFMKQASENGHLEIEASQVALEKATNPEVKAFAQHMITDHTKVGAELMALAKSKNVEVPMDPSLLQKAKMELMDLSKGASFDRRYAETIGVKAHEQTVALFQKAAADAQDPEVKAWAAKTLPSLQAHLAMARKLQANLAGAK